MYSQALQTLILKKTIYDTTAAALALSKQLHKHTTEATVAQPTEKAAPATAAAGPCGEERSASDLCRSTKGEQVQSVHAKTN